MNIRSASMATINQREMLELALIGANKQLQQATEQVANIRVQLSQLSQSEPSAAAHNVGMRLAAAAKRAKSAAAKKRAPMSPEARARVVAAQKKRWAAYRKDQKAQKKVGK